MTKVNRESGLLRGDSGGNIISKINKGKMFKNQDGEKKRFGPSRGMQQWGNAGKGMGRKFERPPGPP